VVRATPSTSSLGGVTVTFSAPVSDAVSPNLVPELPGSWTHPTATTAVFRPSEAPVPGATFTVSLGKGTVDAAGGALAASWSSSWQIRGGDPARLQQLLAEAGYLPLSFHASTAEPTTAAGIYATAYAARTGSYAWRFAAPPGLRGLFTGPTSTLLTRGAVLAFESAHDLATDGSAGPQVWAVLAQAVASRTVTAAPYTSVSVTKARPESLTLYQDGKAVLTTKANTGVAGAPTPDGSWAVYARFRSETMSGTNPDGTHYSDPGVPWISYFYGGDAVHGFPRATYGSPQSVGCVELPIPTAAKVWALMGYGDIVTVAG
jgi:lipoprotein-anchoring transpeptidase ErfK/SrfK